MGNEGRANVNYFEEYKKWIEAIINAPFDDKRLKTEENEGEPDKVIVETPSGHKYTIERQRKYGTYVIKDLDKNGKETGIELRYGSNETNNLNYIELCGLHNGGYIRYSNEPGKEIERVIYYSNANTKFIPKAGDIRRNIK